MGSRVIDDQPEIAKGIAQMFCEAHESIENNQESVGKLWAEVADIHENLAVRMMEDIQPKKTFNLEPLEKICKMIAETMIIQGLIDKNNLYGTISGGRNLSPRRGGQTGITRSLVVLSAMAEIPVVE